MRLTVLVLTAMIGAAGPACAQTLPGSEAPDEALSIRNVDRETGSFLGSPIATEDGKLRIWSWSFFDTGGRLPNGSSFLNEFDCAARTYRRVRQEFYEGDHMEWARTTPARFRAPTGIEVEADTLRLVCDGGLDALPRVASPVAARALLRGR